MGDTVYGEVFFFFFWAIYVILNLSVVGSIPELGAWCLSRRVPVFQKVELGARAET